MKYSITRLSNQLIYLPHIIDTRRGSSLDSYGDTQLLQSSLANLIAMGPPKCLSLGLALHLSQWKCSSLAPVLGAFIYK